MTKPAVGLAEPPNGCDEQPTGRLNTEPELEQKSLVVESEKHRVVVFIKAPPHAYNSFNYMTKEMFNKLGFVRVDYGDHRRKIVKEVRVEIHGFTFLVDFAVIRYANEGEPSMIFGRDFLVTLKSKVDFGIGDFTMLEEERDLDVLLEGLVENVEDVGSSNGELVKIRKASRNKGHNFNKLTPPPPPPLKFEEILQIYSIAP
nr:hypothetical protein [Tanacetum cinerariifolium]